jgi:hypothetical protein
VLLALIGVWAAANVYDRRHPKLGHPPFDWRQLRPWLALCRYAAEAVRFVEGAGRTARLGPGRPGAVTRGTRGSHPLVIKCSSRL